jgi:NADP-dependent 3-hydroxy acid dehydrogenase YdfG
MEKDDGRVALVTGASSGIGEATAWALARHGTRIVVAARRADRLEALADHIGRAGGQVMVQVADVTDEQQMRALVRRTQEQWGRLDILVNSAGLMLLGPIAGADTDDWRRMISTNLLGLMYATHAALPLMRAQKSGHIINISSVAGRIARAGSGVYNATKWGVGAFSEALRQECVPDHIRVTVIERIASRKNVTRAGLLPHEISYRRCLITAVSGRRGRPCVRTQTPSSPSA